MQNQQPEEWRDIPGYEGLYQVSTLGRVKSVARGNKKERIRIPRASNNGYLYIVLSKENNIKTVRVHRIVAEVFIPNPLGLKTVNHKNFDKTDNTISNLEWMSGVENIQHAVKNGKGISKPVLQCDSNGNVIREWSSAHLVETTLGFHSTLISRCCRGIQKHHKGFIWKFKTVK